MRRKRKRNPQKGDAYLFDTHHKDLDDDFDDDFDDDLESISDLSKDFYSTDWEDPAGSERRFSTRRRLERRNDLKNLMADFDDWDEFDLRNEW